MIASDVGRKGLLTLLFAASFSIPLFIGAHFFSAHPKSQQQSDESDPIFPNRLQLHGQSAFISVASDSILNPQPDSEYLISTWFKLGQLPSDEEEVTLFSKIDQSNRLKPGYMLSLVKRGGSIRPVLYWKNEEGKGGTYEFSTFRLLPRVWNSFVLTFKEGSLLGLHRIEQEEGKKPVRELLGGFRLTTSVIPTTTAPLIIGSEAGKQFKGSVGPLAIVSGPHVLNDFNDTLKAMSRDPQRISDLFNSKDVVFFTTDGTTDISEYHRTITKSAMVERVIRLERKKQRDNSNAE